MNPSVPGLIATGSPDPESPVKIWDISAGQPACIYAKTSPLGPVFSLQWAPQSFLLAVGVQGQFTHPKM